MDIRTRTFVWIKRRKDEKKERAMMLSRMDLRPFWRGEEDEEAAAKRPCTSSRMALDVTGTFCAPLARSSATCGKRDEIM